MIEDISGTAPMITAITGVCTFFLTAWVALQARAIHNKTDELVVHTNSLTDKLVAKTDSQARAEGFASGQANPLQDPQITQRALADLMAQAVIAAAALAADKVLADAKLAKEAKSA